MIAAMMQDFAPLAPIVDALGWTLVHFLWQGALAGAATALALAELRDARPQLRYAAACAGLLACVLWPAVTLALRLRAAGIGGDTVQAARFAGWPQAASAGLPMAWIVCAWAVCCVALLARTALGMAWIAHATRTGARDAHWQRQLDGLEKRQFAHHEPALAADGGDLMKRVTRLLRPASSTTARRGLSATVSAVLATVLPALALAGAVAAGKAQADVVAAHPDKPARVDFKSCAKPAWPHAALAAQQTGTVTLSFLVGKDGRVADAKVHKSSGHPALDDAAMDGIRKCRFSAGEVKGKPVKSWVQMQYVWTLD